MLICGGSHVLALIQLTASRNLHLELVRYAPSTMYRYAIVQHNVPLLVT
jgi:hypothetical protein